MVKIKSAATPSKHYYISVLPGDVADVALGTAAFGHAMAGVAIKPGQTTAIALAPRNPLPAAQMSIFVFEDSGATNGDVDEGEVGLGGFRVEFADTRGQSGDVAGAITYDMFAMPLTNSLMDGTNPDCPKTLAGASEVGVVITCPDYSSEANKAAGIRSPLAGMALIKNMIPGRMDVFAMPAADRVAAGEQWIQVSTLEGSHANDLFVKPGEPPYWQEFGSPGFHSFIGFVNPAHVKKVHDSDQALNAGTGTVSGRITSLHMDRPSAANLNNSCQPGSLDPTCARAALAYTNCYVALNEVGQIGRNIAMTRCDDNGNYNLTGIPDGSYTLFIWDEWLDQIKAMKSVIVKTDPLVANSNHVAMGDIPVFTWWTRLEQSTYSDLNGNGIREAGEPGIANLPMNIRFRDGSIAYTLFTDNDGVAAFNETFPLFNWYVAETNWTRFKGTGVNVTYDAGGLTDKTGPYAGVLNSEEITTLPADKQVPGAIYDVQVPGITHPHTTSRIDPGSVTFEGFQGYINQTQVIDWGTAPYKLGENGGIGGMVYYGSTRGVDDPATGAQTPWSPGIPGVQLNLYLKKPDGNLQLVDTNFSNSWDAAVAPGSPTEPHCPGNAANDPFINYTLGAANQFKCYDGQHNFNQVQPAPYDGFYSFPSANNCKICDPITGQLPAGIYVVEVMPPDGYESVKEEDKNIYGGDSWIKPNTVQQFAGFSNIFILPDTATLNSNYHWVSGPANPPCVGNIHRVPPFLSQIPEAHLYTPFAGQDKPLCDRKEVRLGDMTAGAADFQLFTPTPVAAHFSGMMLNDAAAEFDPHSPSFGEKAALPNAPVSIRDYNGVEILRTYNDKWGTFNGLVPSTWNANAPNPSGYAENMLTNCMNDPGPIIDRRPGSSTNGQLIIDPMYNPMFSNFCYTWPFMPGITTYLDTPVLPVAAFASGTSYNPVDCQYPDATPAIRRVDGNVTGGAPAFAGPYIDKAQANKTLTITALGDVDVLNPAYLGPTAMTADTTQPKIKRHYGFGTQGAKSKVTLGGIELTVAAGDWSDSKIVASVPATAVTGQLVITADNGKTSEDAVTVTIEDSSVVGYHPPAYVTASTVSMPDTRTNLGLAHPLQDAIDAATPGDLILVNEGHYPELVIMWKPVRLQGVGAAAVVINAAKYPTTKVDNWRARINPLFGVDAAGNALPGISQIDPLPGQTVTGGLVQFEPTALSTEEGPGIVVLAKNPAAINCNDNTLSNAGSPVKDSNFTCAASRIDGVTVTGGDTGGGIYVNGWAHNLEISNNRIYGNAGTVNGGLRIGQEGMQGQAPGANGGLGYDVNVNIHHNAITTNGTVEANAAVLTPGGAAPGGIAIFAGSDNYNVSNNWVCGNFSSGDGGGIGHIGLSLDGNISHNKILFNQSYNQGSTVNGGGLAVEGETPTGTALTLGSGNVTVDSNLIMGNFAQSGHGGGVMLSQVNGEDVAGPQANWWKVTMTNNMITNNVAGWSGGGISLADTLNSAIINNTVASNDSTGIAGSLFNTMVNGTSTGPNTTVPSAAGISADLTNAALLAAAGGSNSYKVSNPTLTNNVIWKNRSFFFDMSTGVTRLLPSNQWSDAVAPGSLTELVKQTTTGECVAGGKYWDIGVIGDTSPTPGTNMLNPTYSILSSITGYTGAGIKATDPGLVKLYCNGSRAQPGAQFEPATPFLPNFQMSPAATLDEAGNFVDLHFGPLSLTDFGSTNIVKPMVGDYHLVNITASAYDAGTASGAPAADFDGDQRPQDSAYDIGADEIITATVTSPLNFNNVQVGTTSNVMFTTLTNVGINALTFTNVNFSGTNAADFTSPGNTCTASLSTGEFCTIAVTFTPSLLGNESATMTVHDATGAVTHTQVVVLSGTGVPPTGTALPTPLAFGNMQVGTTSAAKTVTVTNTGLGKVNFTSATITGMFAVQTDNCAGKTLDPASLVGGTSTCTIDVTFTPVPAGTNNGTGSKAGTNNGTGSKAGTLSLTETGVNSTLTATQSVSLSGNGVAPSGSVNPTSLSFGNMQVATTSAAKIVTVTNTGLGPVTLSAVFYSGNFGQTVSTQYAQTNDCGASLQAQASCTISVSFTPSTVGNKLVRMILTETGVNSILTATQTVSLSGNGVVPVGTATSLNFNNMQVATTGAPMTVTVSNTGLGKVTISTGAIAGSNASEFAVQADNCAGKILDPASLVGGTSTCTIGVTFTPTSTGSKSGTLQLIETAYGSSPAVTTALVANLSGNGVGPTGTVLPTPLAFGDMQVATTSAPMTVTVSNTGLGKVTISTGTITGSNASEFAVQADNCVGKILDPSSLVGGTSTCTIIVTFTPTTTANNKFGTLPLTETAYGSSPAVTRSLSVSLSGNGVNPRGTASPSPLAFGNVLAGSVTVKTLTVTNTGLGQVTIAVGAITGANASEFAVTANNCTGKILAPGSAIPASTCTIDVILTAVTTGSKTATLPLTETGVGTGGTSTLINESLTASSMTVTGTVTPTSVNFGSRQVNTTSPSSMVTLRNTSTGTVNLSTAFYSGASGTTVTTEYARTTGGGNCGASLAAGAICNYYLTFTPSTTGSRPARFVVTETAPGLPALTLDLPVTLDGIGINLNISPTILAFGNELLNTTSAVRAVTVTNNGINTVGLGTPSLSGVTNGATFALQGGTCITSPSLAAGASCDYNVTFTTTSTGNKTATMRMMDSNNIPLSGVATVSLSGTGVLLATPNPTLSFGTGWAVGSSTTLTETLTNNSNGALTINNPSLPNTTAATNFSWVNNCGPAGSSLPPGGICTISVTFRPLTTGTKTTTMGINYLLTGSTTVTTQGITLTGN